MRFAVDEMANCILFLLCVPDMVHISTRHCKNDQ